MGVLPGLVVLSSLYSPGDGLRRLAMVTANRLAASWYLDPRAVRKCLCGRTLASGSIDVVSEREEFDGRLGALARTWGVWAGTGAALSDAQWRQPTRCGRWDVRALYAHHSGFPAALAALPQAAAPVAASDVLRAFNAPGGVAVVKGDAIAGHALAGVQCGNGNPRSQAASSGFRRDDSGRTRRARSGPEPAGPGDQGCHGVQRVYFLALMERAAHFHLWLVPKKDEGEHPLTRSLT